jgi:hypothetical protein
MTGAIHRIIVLACAGAILAACGKSDFDVKIASPDVPATTGGVAASSVVHDVAVAGADQLNFVAKPLTSICHSMNFKVTYADATIQSIKQALARVGGGKPAQKRTFVVTVHDFNARVMSLMVQPYVFRHDSEVRVTLISREKIAGSADIVRQGASSLYHEPPLDDSGFCDKGQESLAVSVKNALSEALAKLVQKIELGGQDNIGTSSLPRGGKAPSPSS